MKTTILGEYPHSPAPEDKTQLNPALADFNSGKISGEELIQIQRKATEDIIKEMQSAGLDLISDGMARWQDPISHFTLSLSGVEHNGTAPYFDSGIDYNQPLITGELKWTNGITVDDYKFASNLSDKPLAAYLPGPFTLAMLSKDEHYGDKAKLVKAYCEALNFEIKALSEAGCKRVAVKEPGVVNFHDEAHIFFDSVEVLLDGVNVETAIYTYYGVIGRIRDMLFNSPFDIIGLDFVINERNWDFVPVFPDDKKLSFGIIDARSSEVEDREDVSDAISDILEFIPSERLIINPNCELKALTRDVAYRKLKNMVDIVGSFEQ
ncbi:MAG: hypothetical protein GF307_11560 [candidate division Zixibacteria bacterium]|nr:hypothetical protein [candidate division Zixibacteria bacterium]